MLGLIFFKPLLKNNHKLIKKKKEASAWSQSVPTEHW